ncbi:MAG TPA: hypothetical protein VJO52_12895 [Gemmatimonadaceae bacterium]|nr:hypothetical protein [Gemmatimonadaceae bacterium]
MPAVEAIALERAMIATSAPRVVPQMTTVGTEAHEIAPTPVATHGAPVAH